MASEIRPATSSDLFAVSTLLADTWHATYDGIYGHDRVADITARWHSIEALSKGVSRAEHAFLVAVVDDHVVGTISIGRACGGGLKLDRLYVHPKAQRRGLGRELLAAGLGAFPANAVVTLEVEPANAEAIRFYQMNGFAVTGRSGDCSGSGDGIAALVMTRDPAASSATPAALADSTVSSDGMAANR